MSESEIADLCRKIYRKHQRALDMIYEYRPDRQAAVQEILMDLVKAETSLNLDDCSKSYIRFYPKNWGDSSMLLRGDHWTSTKHILLFQFGNYPDRLNLYLIIGPGPVDIRQKLLDVAHNNRPFKPAFRALGKNFNTIFQRSFLTPKFYQDAGMDEIETEIKTKWIQFLEHDLPEIQEILRNQEWIWQHA